MLRVGGYRFFFFSNEGTEPPHIHVESADSYAKFWLTPVVTLTLSIGYNATELNRIRQLVDHNAITFLGKWNEYFGIQ